MLSIPHKKLMPNRWDFLALLLVFSFFILLVAGAKEMSAPYQLGQVITFSLSPAKLPMYALQTTLRMFMALFFALLFTFTVGALAAKSRHAERIIIPVIDVLQSVPVMGFLSITALAFIALFPGSLWGVQCAAIFAIFTSQVWNIALSFYQSLLTLPKELTEVGRVFHLSAWQQFWRVEVPFAMPGLLWNIMLSMSGSWFFVVACEAVTVCHQTITLPGIGSYIAVAIQNKNISAIMYTILAMLCVILLYDQLLFRPLIQWSNKFAMEQPMATGIPSKNSWIANLFQRTLLCQYLGVCLSALSDKFINSKIFNVNLVNKLNFNIKYKSAVFNKKLILMIVYVLLVVFIMKAFSHLWHFIFAYANFKDIKKVFFLGCLTAIRVFSTVGISTLIWLPTGVWIGLRPRIAKFVQPIVQFLAAFPVNLVFPLCVILMIKYRLNINTWTISLMLLGTQWYILFNVIAGTSALPKVLQQVAANFGVKKWLWWKRLILPGIFPYYITGAITAMGSAWNTSTIVEIVNWGDVTLQAKGLGAYIMQNSMQGNFPNLVLGISVMSLFVLMLNRLVWQPLYQLAHSRS